MRPTSLARKVDNKTGILVTLDLQLWLAAQTARC